VDAGLTWDPVFDGESALGVGHIAVFQPNPISPYFSRTPTSSGSGPGRVIRVTVPVWAEGSSSRSTGAEAGRTWGSPTRSESTEFSRIRRIPMWCTWG
jgi:hypothetical protein